MQGSDKQIKWAEQIKAQIATGFHTFTPHPVMDKATDYILNIDDARFWIEIAKSYTDNPIALVMLFARQGLLTKGNGFDDLAKIDEKTGKITTSNKRRT